MEVTYGAALHLIMANALFPHSTSGYNYSEQAHSVFDEMIFKENRIAVARKTELSHLEDLFRELATRIESHGLQTLTLSTPEHLQQPESMMDNPPVHAEDLTKNTTNNGSDIQIPHENPGYLPSGTHLTSDGDLLDGMGISSYEFLSIIEQIGGAESSLLDPEPSWEHGM